MGFGFSCCLALGSDDWIRSSLIETGIYNKAETQPNKGTKCHRTLMCGNRADSLFVSAMVLKQNVTGVNTDCRVDIQIEMILITGAFALVMSWHSPHRYCLHALVITYQAVDQYF